MLTNISNFNGMYFPKEEDRDAYINEEKSPVMYDRLLNLASSALAEVSFITLMFGTHFQISS